jgi:drug/metabolite transporter (DMT)-like permease
VTAIVFAPAALTGEVWPDGNQWIYLALFGSLQMGLPYVLFARGLQSVSSHEASGIALLEPVLVPVWVYVAWRGAADYQLPAVTTMIGAVLIMAGLLASYWPNKKPLSRPEASTNPQNPTS